MRERRRQQVSLTRYFSVAGTRHDCAQWSNETWVKGLSAGGVEKCAVVVRGGTFSTFLLANILGSRGRGTLEIGAVAVGLRLQFEMDEGRWIVTTPIEQLAIVPAGAMYREVLPS